MHLEHRSLTVAALLMTAAFATSQSGYHSDFEGLMASTSGVQLWDPAQPPGTLGQDNYYAPNTTSVPHLAYTYAGNTLSVPPNPNGGNIFIAGTGPAGGVFARAQRDITTGCNTGIWTFGTDLLIQFNGTLPTAQFIGSFSSQPGAAQFIMLASWVDISTGQNWNADLFVSTTVGGNTSRQTGFDPNFTNLNVNTWYRWETDVDLGTREIKETRITDLMTGVTNTHTVPAMTWFLGGSGNLTGFRFFAGGSVSGNTIAWDNPVVLPGKIKPIPGCTNPPNSLTTSGFARLGDTVTFSLDAPSGTVSAGSIAIVAIGFTPGVNLPCGVPLGIPNLTVTGNLLIGMPAFTVLFSPMPWAGPGMPANVVFPMPPDIPFFCPFIGTSLFAQGALLDGGMSSVVLTTAKELVLGG